MPSFGSYESQQAEQNQDREEGEYPALITKAELPRKDGEFVKNEWGKSLCDVTFALEGDVEDTVRRRYAISFNQNNQTGAWSAFAELLAAACGVPCGAKNQRSLGTEDLEGQWVRVVMKWQKKGERSYFNVTSVLAPKKDRKPAPEGGQVQGSTRQDKFDEIDDEIPSPF